MFCMRECVTYPGDKLAVNNSKIERNIGTCITMPHIRQLYIRHTILTIYVSSLIQAVCNVVLLMYSTSNRTRPKTCTVDVSNTEYYLRKY